MRLFTLSLVVAFGLAYAGIAQGQQGQQGQGQGQQGQGQQGQSQQGKTGQGLPAQAMPGQPGYFGYTQTPWFTSPNMQKQLNLNEEQMSGLNKAWGEGWNKYSQGMSTLGTLDEKARAQKMQELNSTLNSQSLQSAKGTLKPEQYERFEQLNLQYQGLNAFTDPTLQQKLKLTPEQIQKIQDLNSQQTKTLTDIQKRSQTDQTAASEQFQQFRKQNDQQLNSILNEQQQATWRQLIGQPYDFTPEGLQINKK